MARTKQVARKAAPGLPPAVKMVSPDTDSSSSSSSQAERGRGRGGRGSRGGRGRGRGKGGKRGGGGKGNARMVISSSSESEEERPAEKKGARGRGKRGGVRCPKGVGALGEIKHFQSTTDFVIPVKPFKRLVKDITENSVVTLTSHRYSPAAIHALQAASETFLTNLLENANLCAHHAGRVTLMPRDIQLTLRILGESQ